MPYFRVTWEIDVEADDQLAAIKEAKSELGTTSPLVEEFDEGFIGPVIDSDREDVPPRSFVR